MGSHIALDNLSSSIKMEDNRWVVTGMLIAFPSLISLWLGKETAGAGGSTYPSFFFPFISKILRLTTAFTE